jgi:hypothetical protein
MNRLLPLIVAVSIILFSCDIRKQEKKPDEIATEPIKDSTIVAIIDSVYDFGKVNEGEMVEHRFQFKNTGSKPLTIINAQASCGCTVPEKPEEPIQPGAIGFIKVKFNSDKRPGEARKTITVTSNARPEFPVLILKGTVVGKAE